MTSVCVLLVCMQVAVSIGLQTDLHVSKWLKQNCTADAECPVPNSQCFKGECLCTPGYYYSDKNRTCITNCSQSDLRAFVLYPNSAMGGDYIDYIQTKSAARCLESCRNLTDCRSITYYHPNVGYSGEASSSSSGPGDEEQPSRGEAGDCIRYNITAIAPNTTWHQDGLGVYDYYQRRCA